MIAVAAYGPFIVSASLQKVEEIAGRSYNFYRLEFGRQSITVRTLKIVADALGVKVRDLVWEV
ncbi:MAG: hypothetical protein QOJ99_1179, partial [Bryobacterales bacterium]|jgi:hypothetical protein|nr:hypothetical protein [Bryobacterales bacterium]